MTPVPFDLPVRTSEAAKLAALIFEHADRKPLNDDLRNRLQARAAALGLEAITPYFGSLEKDPVHPSAFYLAVDGNEGRCWLLHFSAETAPATALFPSSILIGRMRPGGREAVVNATPFGPLDTASILRFAEKINPSFFPRPQGARPTLAVCTADPAASLPAAFDAFRSASKRLGVNVACVADVPEPIAIWAAIRAGWREGFSAMVTVNGDGDLENARQIVRDHPWATRFAVETSDGARAETLYDFIRQTKAAGKQGKSFDFELRWTGPDLPGAVARLRDNGRLVQIIGAPGGKSLEELTTLARQLQAVVSVPEDRRQSASGHRVASSMTLQPAASRDLQKAILEAIEELVA